ncbi:YfhD family protein [Sutcliffiella halmapala]|uniref:YfhD family protein n=1 Tax=Sutcliffiella halmapala TaxID=79882 RepID=UPI000994D4F0|nr:YfhD family protein [Sutcliffiella halmapala]
MGRSRGHKSRGKNKSSLPQVPKNAKTFNHDAEFAKEYGADSEILEAQALASAAGIKRNSKTDTFK